LLYALFSEERVSSLEEANGVLAGLPLELQALSFIQSLHLLRVMAFEHLNLKEGEAPSETTAGEGVLFDASKALVTQGLGYVVPIIKEKEVVDGAITDISGITLEGGAAAASGDMGEHTAAAEAPEEEALSKFVELLQNCTPASKWERR
jgi:hypothetical protein